MGVSGAGKTTVGRRLAATLDWDFLDADDFHPPANRRKMASGRPLDDADRGPWLDRLRRELDTRRLRGRSVVLACSALKRSYRTTLLAGRPEIGVVFLHGSRELLARRLAARQGHFMAPELLTSQLATLEAPSPEEALILDVEAPPERLVREILCALDL